MLLDSVPESHFPLPESHYSMPEKQFFVGSLIFQALTELILKKS